MPEMDLVSTRIISSPDINKTHLVRHIYFLDLLKKLDQEFLVRKIPIWILKGPALVFRYYENASERKYTDLDVFV